MSRTVLVAGATGVVGRSAAQAFADAGWGVHAAARRAPSHGVPGVSYHRVDLLDPASCRDLCAAVGPVDELVYCAINEASGSLVEKWTDPAQTERNCAMLVNLLDAVLPRSPAFRHISIVHGTKAYGTHLPGHVFTVPHREDDPRVIHDNFYFGQEDEVARRAKGQGWSWTIFRAPIILGGGVGTNLSNFLALGVLAAIARERGEPFPFLGAPVGGVFEVVDADLLGRALVWAATAPQASNMLFNISNGDVAQWRGLWPIIAEANGVEVGEDMPWRSCAAMAHELAPLRADIVARYSLAAPADLRAFLGESFALLDFALPSRLVTITSTIKLRKAGFGECADTSGCIRRWYWKWREQRLLPPL